MYRKREKETPIEIYSGKQRLRYNSGLIHTFLEFKGFSEILSAFIAILHRDKCNKLTKIG